MHFALVTNKNGRKCLGPKTWLLNEAYGAKDICEDYEHCRVQAACMVTFGSTVYQGFVFTLAILLRGGVQNVQLDVLLEARVLRAQYNNTSIYEV